MVTLDTTGTPSAPVTTKHDPLPEVLDGSRAPGGDPADGAADDAGAEDAGAGTRWLDDDEQRTWRAFLSATQLLTDRIDRQLQHQSGVVHTYYEMLVRLSEAPDRSLRMSELADSSLSSRSRVSHAVARMEERGWIHREPCATDGRGYDAVLTPAGMKALEAAAPAHVETVRSELFDQLDEAQLTALREISETLLRHLTSTGGVSPVPPVPPTA